MTIDPNLRVSDFDYDLPQELIAQTPLPDRDRARLLVLDRASGAIDHSWVYELPRWLRPGDLLVANNSRVIPARLHARKTQTGGQVEILLLQAREEGIWTALARPARRLHPGTLLRLIPRNPTAPAAALEIIARREDGLVEVRFLDRADLRLEEYGETPLPPYIHQELHDAERYQTVYARVPGSAAAPTAGLHITERLRQQLEEQGVGWAEVTLHIGLDTFRPVSVERVADHKMHTEWCQVSDDTARQIASAKASGGRIVAIGTTSARTLETLGTAVEPGATTRLYRSHRHLYNAWLPVATGGCAVDELPPAAVHAAHDGERLRREGSHPRRLSRGHCAALPLLFLRRRHAHRVGLSGRGEIGVPRFCRAESDRRGGWA
ncbi:MAG: hypothetical protein KatS3mg059_0151 [Thermomicrobiales bacterium]|nr:MAG: hypothetical protein KatS3mg059_0151 [Thermomicrobiales bacterium]